MRIHYVLGAFPEISQTFVLEQMVGLKRLGAEISITAEPINYDQAGNTMAGEYGLMDVASQPGPLARRYAGPQPGTPAQRLIRAAFGTFCAPLIRRFLHPPAYDAILCHFGPNGLKALCLKDLGHFAGPLAVQFHGYDMSMFPREHGPDVYRRLFAEGDLMLPVSDFWMERLTAMGCPREKIRVHRMGIDPGRFAFQPRTPRDVFHFLSLGRFTEKKGFVYLLEAASILRRRGGPPFRITMAGYGELRDSLMHDAGSQGLDEIVSFPGAVHQREVGGLMARADAFIAPSVTAENGDMEGIPVALMEAMASGLPVISTRHSGIPELVEDGVSGLLAKERDPDGLAEAMATMMDDAALGKSLAAAARRKVEHDFDANALNGALLEELAGLRRA